MILGSACVSMRKHRHDRSIHVSTLIEVRPVAAGAGDVRVDCADGFADASAVGAVWCTFVERVTGARSTSMNSRKALREYRFRGLDAAVPRNCPVGVGLRSGLLDSAVGNAAAGVAPGFTRAIGEFGDEAGCGR